MRQCSLAKPASRLSLPLLIAAASLAAALLPAGGGAAAAASTGYTVSLVPVSSTGSELAIDTATNTLYLTNGTLGQLIVVNAATGAVETTLSLGKVTAEDVAVDQATDMIYVTEASIGGVASVVVVNGSTNTVAATITEPAGSNPVGIAVDAATDTVYVANIQARNVTVIDGKTNAITATVSTGSTSRPHAVTVDVASDIAWVADGSGTVIGIDGTTDTIASTLALSAAHPYTIAVDLARNTVYAGTSNGHIYVIDGATASLITTITAPAAAPGLGAAMAVDPVAGIVYATSPGATWIIDSGTHAITDTLARGGSSVAIASAGNAYETGSQYGLWLVTPSSVNAMSPVITTASTATFTTGQAGSATIEASALPTATFSESGTLPAGLTWNSDGTLSGTPAAGTGGVYPITITASNGIAPDFTQSFGVVVDQPIVITSPASATFRVAQSSSFTFASTGYPTPYYQVSGTLPAGVSLRWSQATGWRLTGTPASGSGGVYRLTIHALDGNGDDVTQAFTLTVDQPPAITSGSRATFRVGHHATFTIRTTGYPRARLTERGRLPKGVTFSRRSNGTAVLTGNPARTDARRTYVITITAGNGIGSAARQTFRLKVT